jgi:iron complex transport system permease protein
LSVTPGSVGASASEPSLVDASTRRRARRTAVVYTVLVLVLAALIVGSVVTGPGALSDAAIRSTLLSLRTTRLVAALLVGASLGAAGVLVQGLFRNPLADASILGTSAGAVFGGNGAVLALELLVKGRALRGVPPDAVLPLGCLAGALVALAVLMALLRRTGDVLSVILTGFLLSSLFLSLGSLLTSIAQERWMLGRAVVAFALGGLTGTGGLSIALAAPLVVAGLVAAWFWGRPLDLLLSGDEEAASLGVDVRTVRHFTVLWTAVLTAAAVSLGGNVAFVGLLVPHALRPLVGVDHRRLIPAAALGGAVFVAACDLLARAIPAQGEVPLGVITGLLGAPAFLALLIRNQREALDA